MLSMVRTKPWASLVGVTFSAFAGAFSGMHVYLAYIPYSDATRDKLAYSIGDNLPEVAHQVQSGPQLRDSLDQISFELAEMHRALKSEDILSVLAEIQSSLKSEDILSALMEMRGSLKSEDILSALANLEVKRASDDKNSDIQAVVDGFDQAMQVPDIVSGYDLFFKAMVVDSSDPRIFDMASRFISWCIANPSEENDRLAYELYARLENLVPFQALSDIPRARRELDSLGTKLADHESVVANTEQANVEGASAQVENPQFEAARQTIQYAAGIVLERPELVLSLMGSISSLVAGSAAESMYPVDEIEYWKEFDRILSDIERVELAATESLYKEVHSEVQSLLTNIVDGDSVSQVEQMLVKVFPYSRAKIKDATEDERKLELRISEIRWKYNQIAVKAIETSEAGRLPPEEGLRDLAKIDVSRLHLVYQERYYTTWKRLFEECSPAQQEAALMQQIMRGMNS